MLEHDMCHSCTFEIVEQDRYREFANSTEQKQMFEECGAELVYSKRNESWGFGRLSSMLTRLTQRLMI